MSDCYTCQLVSQRDAGNAPLWDNIYRTDHWDVVHSYNTALLGWTVLVMRRHITAIDEMTESEAAELGQLIRQVSVALKETTGCLKTYVVQFAEAAEHPHVHFHVIPRMADQPLDRKSTEILNYLGVPEDERIDEAVMNEIASTMQRRLHDMNAT